MENDPFEAVAVVSRTIQTTTKTAGPGKRQSTSVEVSGKFKYKMINFSSCMVSTMYVY